MKKILSAILCFALLLGVLPLGAITALAKSPEVKEISDIVVRLDVSGNAHITFSGVPTAVAYYVQCGEGYGHWFYISDESQNEGTLSYTFGNAAFSGMGTGGQTCPRYRARVYANNFYGEMIAEGWSDYFRGPYERFIGVPRECYLSPTGLFLFNRIDEAANYSISCLYNGHYLKGVSQTSNNYLDISDIAREGDYYEFIVTVWPKGKKILPSRVSLTAQFTSEKKLAGSVSINDDKSLSYDWYLGYLDKRTSTPINVQWQKYVPGEETDSWVDITESQKNEINLYDLRVKVTVEGHTGEVISNHNSYTDPSSPYIATDYAGLRAVFNQNRDEGRTAYIRLGSDIEATGSRLQAYGGNVDLDLCGYTIYYRGKTPSFIWSGETNIDSVVTIRDSKRYDSDKNEWVEGGIYYANNNLKKVPYGRETHGDHTYYAGELYFDGSQNSIITGNVTVYGGVFVNYTYELVHHQDPYTTIYDYVYGPYYSSHYYGLKMYGGTFYSRRPINLDSAPAEKREEYGIFGGTIMLQGETAIRLRYGGNDVEKYNFPVIRNVEIFNESGNSQATAFRVSEQKLDSISELYEIFNNSFMPQTKAYIDGVEQPFVTSGTVGSGDITGPLFSNKYEIKTDITVKNLELEIVEPAVGETPNYNVIGHDESLYDAKLYWYYEATPNHFAEMDSGAMFHSGLWYEALIMLEPRDGVNITEVKGNVTVGSHQAEKYGLMFITTYYINDDFFDIYIGSTHVGKKSKGDVLGDGGSVQIYEPGEYVMSEDDKSYGISSAFTADNPVLVLNNFNLDRPDYHPDETDPAQIYLGESVTVLLQGDNNLYHMTDADGIHIGDECSVRFIGDGSLTADLDQCDRNALSGWGADVYFDEAVNVTLKGVYGINLTSGHDPGEDTLVAVEGDAFLTCGAYATGVTAQNPEPQYYQALSCDNLYLRDAGAIICDAPTKGEAMYTGGTTFSNDAYDILVLKYGEYGIPPYEPDEGINVGGDNESLYHYISIYPRESLVDFFRVNIPEPKVGQPITYEASVPAGRGYKVEEFDDYSIWKDGVYWQKGNEDLMVSDNHVFEAGETYTVEVSLVPSDGRYGFAEFNDVSFSVNGKFANVRAHRYSDSNYSVSYTFTMEEPVIKNISLTIDEPAVGDWMSYYPTAPENADYEVYTGFDDGTPYYSDGVSWDEDSVPLVPGAHVFKAGSTYKVNVAVTLKDIDNYTFADVDEINATINGKQATVLKADFRTYIISYTFAALPVAGYLPGDLDKDGEVTDQDAVYLLFHTFFPDDYPVDQPVDFDGDGEVTDQDAVYLLFYTFFPEDYPID